MAGGGRRIVITGISGHWAGELARRLEHDPSVEFLAGIDTEPPSVELERTELIEADIRNPLLARLLPSTEADTVVHCGFLWYPARGKPDRALHDINVIGALQLLAACERTPTLRTVDTIEEGKMTKDLSLLVGPDQPWLSTLGFLDAIDQNLQKAMA